MIHLASLGVVVLSHKFIFIVIVMIIVVVVNWAGFLGGADSPRTNRMPSIGREKGKRGSSVIPAEK